MTNSTQSLKNQPARLSPLLWAYGLALGLALGIVLVVAGGLFLSTFSPDRLPLAVLVGGGVMLGVTLLFDQLAQRMSFQTLQLAAWIAGAAILGILLVGFLRRESDQLIALLLVVFLGMLSLSEALNRQLLQRLNILFPHYNPTQALEIGQALGAGVGSLLAALMAYEFLLTDSLWLATISLVSGFIVTFQLQNEVLAVDGQDILPQALIKPPSAARAIRWEIFRQPYARRLIQSLILAVSLSPLSLVIALDRIQAEWGDNRQHIALILGGLWASIQFTHILIRVGFFQTLLTRQGLSGILLFSPLSSLVISGGGFVLSLVGNALYPAIGLKLTEEITYQALHRPSLAILYQPMRQTFREGLRNRFEPWGEPLAVFVVGLLLSWLNVLGLYRVEVLLGLSVGLSALWLYITVQLYSAYSQSLDQAVKRRSITGEVILQNDGTTLGVLKNKLKSAYIGEVIYALDLLYQMEGKNASRYLNDLLTHPAPEVRREALIRIEQHHQHVDPKLVAIVIEADDEPLVREIALRVYASLAGVADVENKLLPYLDDPNYSIQRGAMVGLLNHGGQNGMAAAETKLLHLTQSNHIEEREYAAYILGEVKNERFSSYVISLLNDRASSVQREAILAAGRLNSNKYWSFIIPQLGSREVGSAAASALFMANKSVYPMLESVFNQPQPNPNLMIGIARVCGRRRDPQALTLLKSQFRYPDQHVRRQVWVSLNQCQYRAETEREIEQVEKALRAEAAEAAWIFAAQVDLGQDPQFRPLLEAFDKDLATIRENLLLLLGFVYTDDKLKNIRYNFLLLQERREAALEALQNLLSPHLRAQLMPILRDLTPEQRLSSLKAEFPQVVMTPEQRLLAIPIAPPDQFNIWIRALALYLLPQAQPSHATAKILPLLDSLDSLLRETATWTLLQLDRAYFMEHIAPHATRQILQIGAVPMLLTVEKVLILKSVGIFARVADNILVEIAALLEEQDLSSGEILFHMGDAGTSMYIIVSGKIRIYTDIKVVAERADRDFIGEMSLFDDEPRSASAQAITDTKVLILHQEAFQELMANHPEISIGIIRVLSTRLREAMHQSGISPIMLDIFERLAGDQAEPIPSKTSL